MNGLAGWLLRRFVMLPLLVVLAVVLVAAWGVGLVASLVLCPVTALVHRERPRWRVVRILSMAAAYALGDVVCVLLCLLLWLASGLGWRLRAPWCVAAHRRLLRGFLGVLLRAAEPLFGFVLEVAEPARHPEDLLLATGDEPVVVLARHAGPGASFALVHLLMSRYHRHVRVVLKATLRLDPAIDLLLSRTGAVWVDSDPVARIGEAASSLQRGEAMLLFPEGADWTPVRHLAAVARLRRRGLLREANIALRMPHVLPPRPAGTVAALQAAADAPVLIFTHTGHDELLDAATAWQSLPLRHPLQMAWWQGRRPAAVDTDSDTVLPWLQAIWADLDGWIDEQNDLAEVVADDLEAPPLG